MKFLIQLGFGLLISLLSTGVLSQTELAADKPLPNDEIRRALAKKWVAAFSQVDHQIPALSPSQEAWLKGELNQQIITKRSLAAMDSLEYQIYIAKPRTAQIVAALAQIASSEGKSKATEIALWATVANKFIDYAYWQALANLVERKQIDRKIGHVDNFYHQNYMLQASDILSKIVIPYVEGRLP